MTFKELNLDAQLLEAISYMGFEKATPIQEQAIPIILENQDLIACAQTGTGKTGAFVLPILHKLAQKTESDVNTLIVVPTRELAIQIDQQIQGLGYFISVSSMAIYGGGDGSDWNQQKSALQGGTDIIIATPGKLLSHLRMGNIKLNTVKHLILDEADRMLNMGFIEDLKEIISYLPEQRQNLLFSATMPASIEKLAQQILHQPKKISLSISKPAAGVNQQVYLAFDEQKIKLITHLLKERKEYDSIIIFTGTKSIIRDITKALKSNGFPCTGFSSDLEQERREEILRGFRSKQVRILVATDVMSRGIDIKEINMVINYDVPHDAEDYVHRVGRTARANTKGEAVTLVNPKDMHKFHKIEELIERTLPKLNPPEEIGKGPEWRAGKTHGGGNKKKFFKKRRPNNGPKKG